MTQRIGETTDELGKRVIRDALELARTNPYKLFRSRQGKGNLTTLDQVQHHPAHHLLQRLSKTGSSALFKTPPWTPVQIQDAVDRGPHKSAHEYVEFLRGEMSDMIDKGIWITLPYHLVKDLQGLRISPTGVVPQHERRPRTIVDYSYYGVNDDTVRLAPDEAMQFGRALERIMTQIVYANPRYGPVKLIKIDIADGFYRIKVKLEDIPKLGVSFPNLEGETPLVAFPLALPMGWTQSPPYFCAVTETIADVANERLAAWRKPRRHRLDEIADSPDKEEQPSLLMETPPRNPLLPSPAQLQRFVDVFVDDFIAGAQGHLSHLKDVRRMLMHTIDAVFRPLEESDPKHRREPISVDKLLKGDACWGTRKKILGWIVDTVLMTISLPARRSARLREILSDIRPDQKRLSVKTYHKLLGELRSMAIALPGSRGLFSALQQAIHHKQDGRLRLTKGFHAALDDFRYIQHDLSRRPTRLQEIVPTPPTVLGAHDASGYAAGGVIFPDPTAIPRRATAVARLEDNKLVYEELPPGHPVLWRHQFDAAVTQNLVTWENPKGRINNSELELAGGLLHNEASVQCFDIRERTTKAATDNIATMYWMRKGSITADNAAAHLLRMQGLHQRFHRYVHLIDYLEGNRNSALMAVMDSSAAVSFVSDLDLAQQDVAQGVVSSRTVAALGHWSVWCTFTAELGLDPTLQDITDPIPFLQVFAYRYRNGVINPTKQRVRARTVEDAVRSIGQTFKSVGAPDPRITCGKTDFRLQRMLAAYKRQDPPPNRVKPIPTPVIRHIAGLAARTTNPHTQAIADMIGLAFFFLLRPGEYTGTKTDAHPFRLCDVGVFVGAQRVDPLTAPLTTVRNATFVTLEFTAQKNGVRGEVIGLARSGDLELCPVLAIISRVSHLRTHGAPPTTPLATFFDPQRRKLRPVTSTDVTETLRMAAAILGPQLGFLPTQISARSLRAAGAMALLCGHVDTDVIRLLGRWRSDEMLRYLHVQAAPVMRDFASIMLRGGAFTLYPNHEVPIY